MIELNTAAKELVKALDATEEALRKYADAALAVGRESGNPTERGFDSKQIRQRLKAEVIARLSPRAGVLQLEGAPEARRFATARPLPGLV